MVNKYGNDFKNNIFWNKEYPFIPEVTNDFGFTIHEGDIVDYYCPYRKKYFAYRVCKIYNKDYIWCRYQEMQGSKTTWVNHEVKADKLLPHTHGTCTPKTEDFDNQGIFNPLEHFLTSIYAELYESELCYQDDWHFDPDKVDAKRLEEVEKLKSKY